jgi:hypothetical protein
MAFIPGKGMQNAISSSLALRNLLHMGGFGVLAWFALRCFKKGYILAKGY